MYTSTARARATKRWLVVTGNHTGTLGHETARSDTRHGVLLELAPDETTIRIHVDLTDCRLIEFMSGDRVRRIADGLTGEVIESTGMAIRIAVPCRRFPMQHEVETADRLELM